MAGGKNKLREDRSAHKLKAKQLSARMKARSRQRREREVDTVTETPITLRSKFAWVTIVLMVLIIVAASIRVHPAHYRVDYAMTETGENPLMGVVDAQHGYLKSWSITWAQAEPSAGEYVLPDGAPLLEGGARYVVMFDASQVPEHTMSGIAAADDPDAYRDEHLRRCLDAICQLLAQRGDCEYLQTDAQLEGMDAQLHGLYLLCPSADGLYRAPDRADGSWVDTPVAGTGEQIFGNHLSYVLDGGDGEPLSGRVGWALGVRYAEWHSFTRTGDRLFVNMTVDNAGVTTPYDEHELRLTLWRNGEVFASEVQDIDLRVLSSEPVALDGYIDIPCFIEPGQYELCVSINLTADENVRLSLTMPGGRDGYYQLGMVAVR